MDIKVKFYFSYLYLYSGLHWNHCFSSGFVSSPSKSIFWSPLFWLPVWLHRLNWSDYPHIWSGLENSWFSKI